MAGEGEFLEWVRGRFPAAGDDLAVLDRPAGRLLAGVDPVLDGVHLNVAEHGHAAAGRKAAARNLSDLAAMGGRPLGLLVSLVMPRTATLDDAKACVEGAASLGVEVVGGDFASWDGPLAVTACVLGEADRPVPRVGARAGQGLFVTGPLGGSILGRHLTFEPRLAWGRALAGHVSAMMDVSDGLSRDLPRLLDGLGAELCEVPVHDDARRLAAGTGHDPVWHALHDGEDYELLYAADAPVAGVPAWRVGRVVQEGGVRMSGVPVDAGGWEHPLGLEHPLSR